MVTANGESGPIPEESEHPPSLEILGYFSLTPVIRGVADRCLVVVVTSS